MAIPNPYSAAYVETTAVEPRWGLGDAVVGWLIGFVAAGIFGVLVFQAAGYEVGGDDVPLWLFAVSNIPLWIAFVAVPVVVARTKGNGWIQDFHVAIKAWDVPLGIVVGIASQLILVPLISLPLLELLGRSVDDLSKPAQELADKANGAGGALLFFLIVGLFAPIAEELFFRGLVFRSFEKRWGQWWALAGSSLVFGATHFQALQFLPLVAVGAVFGYLVIRTGRLGPAVLAHMAFNTTTVVTLLWIS